ncbi:SDR family NAD(P)-dependent oxidoreductase [Pedobacter metabolipauper]|uniref:3-oxoacyl-[acyl-carrier protein] reductase n=1 Tax=Pedobacter metabolipauper TaxID=425513 RepID=A0A4R6SSU4_9SPHI|nr:SDR family oxidoreductase [Pedobacter metabolipauper]TDQ08465.1 3-oxoacyl-[acyl-carrier protein] reductase [Pedobacter metabolipauper]
MKKLANKIALVTGGSRGIGAATVRRLASDGALVAFTYTNSAETAEAIVNEINAADGRAIAIRADSSKSADIIHAVNKTVAEFGGLDILVNNAGIYIGKDFQEHTIEEYDQLMDVNVKAVYVAALEAVKHLKAGGRIITIGSNMADNAIGPQTTLYTMSKSALQGFTRGLARDLGPKGITVTLVQPGPTHTDMNPDNTEQAGYLRSRMALPNYGSVEDVAGLVSFLASDEGKQITGSWVTVDGGLNA